MKNNDLHDVTGWGVVAVDDIFYVDSYPVADAKVRATRAVRRLGGLTGVAMVAAANLGGKVCYPGVLGHDTLSRFVMETMSNAGVDMSYVLVRDEAMPVHAVVVVAADDRSRTVFYTTAGRVTRTMDEALAEVIRQSKVILVDPYAMVECGPMLELARSRQIPVIADLEVEHVEEHRPLVPMVDHLVVPLSAAERLVNERGAAPCVCELARDRKAAVVTVGSDGAWYASGDSPDVAHHRPAFKVTVRNTTGCGDVFHGAYALAVARGQSLADCVEFASAAAAVRAEDSAGEGAVTELKRVNELLGAPRV